MEVFENTPFAVEGTDLEFLQRVLRGNLERGADGWVVTRLVGHLALPSGDVLRIRSPKARAAAILAWMAFVDPSLAGLRVVGRVPSAVDAGDIGALAARLFFSELFLALGRHGVGRRYLRTHVVGSTIRGRIDFTMLARRGGDLSKLPCKVWERLPDTPLNRLLATAVESIRRDTLLQRVFASEIAQAQSVFAGLPSVNRSDSLLRDDKLERTELPFAAAAALARVILLGTQLGEGDLGTGAGFIVNLETLFERAVIRAIAHSSWKVLPKANVPYFRVDEHGRDGRESMQMDAFIPRSPVGPVVVDAKYKSSISSANIQQMVTYCFVMGARVAVFVVPAGLVADFRRFEVRPSDARAGPPIAIHLVELDTSARSVEEWTKAGQKLVEALTRLTDSAPPADIGASATDAGRA